MSINNQPPTSSYPIDVAHGVDYFAKGIDAQGPYFRVEYLINSYAQSSIFVDFLLGLVNATGTTYGRRAPHRHPLAPNLYCQSAEVVEGFGGPLLNASGLPQYAGAAKIRAEYRPWAGGCLEMTPNELNQQIDPATPILWCTQEIEGSVETYTLPKTSLKFISDNSPTDMPFRLNVSVMHMNLTFHQVPYLPATVLANAMAAPVNNATFLGVATGLVLYKGFKTSREYQSDGTVAQKVMLSFARRPTGMKWNHLPRPDTLVWAGVVAQSGGGVPYNESDLGALLVF